MKTFTESVGSPAMCTDSLCRSKHYDCPDYGSHTEEGGGIVIASYHDCTCRCCKEGECGPGGADMRTYTFFAETKEKCAPDHCSANFYGCPEEGEGEVLAVYHDCMCACCGADEDCPAEMKYSNFYAGSPEECKARDCSARYFQCPDTGSHNVGAIVEAYYSGVYPPPFPSPPPPTSPSPPPPPPLPPPPKMMYSIDKEDATLPTYSIVLILLSCLGFALALVGLYFRRHLQQRAGFRWVKFDGVEEVTAEVTGAGAQANQQV
jgi:hypothetical protein